MPADDSDVTTESVDGDSQTADGDSQHGTRFDDSSFASLTGDFYRGEVERTASWRGRLDQTTNWAVVVVAAILTWAFSSPDNPHYVILIGVFGVSTFLAMEAVRYREYDVWRNRVRILQEDLFAEMYSPDPSADDDWETELGDGLRDPSFHMSLREAFTHRLRRSYLALLVLLLAAWVARITAFETSETWTQTASILFIPGEAVATFVAAFYLVVISVAVWSARGATVREFQE